MVLNNKFIYRYFFILIVLACLQNLTIIAVAGVVLKPVHIWAILLMPKLIKSDTKVNSYLLFFVLIAIICSVCNAFRFNINGLIINYVFGIYLTLIITMNRYMIHKNEWVKLVCDASFVIMVIIIIKDIIEYRRFIEFFNNPWNGHPAITTIYGSGVNLEASWTCLFSFFYKNDRRKWLYIILCFIICFLFSSRSGFLICILALIVFVLPVLKKPKYLTFSIIGIASAVLIIYKSTIHNLSTTK